MRCVKVVPVLVAVLLAGPAGAGEVRGTVKYTGAPPHLQPFKATRDMKVCGQEVPNESVEVSSGALQNVVVEVKGAPKPAPTTISIDQQNCHYIPHVQAASVGSTLDIINGDPMLHNIHGRMGNQTLFNLAMPLKGQKIPKPLPKAGLVDVKCDVHAWMQGYVWVTDDPAAVSGKQGEFAIKDVPAGTYTVTAWHEKLGEKTKQVTVPAAGEVTVEFAYP